MNDKHALARPFIAVLLDLAEGRFEPDGWFAWWNAHQAELQPALLPGWFSRLKVIVPSSRSPYQQLYLSHTGACYVLTALDVPFVPTERYAQICEAEQAAFEAEQKALRKVRAAQFAPIFKSLTVPFPKFGRFLKRIKEEIEELAPPATEDEIKAVEAQLAIPLPGAFKVFLRCTKRLSLCGLTIGLAEVFQHPATTGNRPFDSGSLCFGDYWLQGDGDQVLFEFTATPVDDPPVYYYAHDQQINRAQQIAESFTAWIEALPKSPPASQD